MTDRHFFDTNVLIYAFDSSDTAKQQIAVNRIDAAVRSNTGVISAQVLGEFFHSLVVRKQLLTALEAERIINDFASGFEISGITFPMVQAAITVHQRYQLRYWDSLIVATANHCGCTEIISEDLNDGQDYSGSTVRNPF